MPVDLFLDAAARRFVEALSEAERLEVQAAIDHLMSDPEPDGTSRIRLPLPYRFGAIGYTAGRFFFTYEFENPATVRILSISRVSPDYWG